MAGFRQSGNNGAFSDQLIQPGDTVLSGEVITSVTGTVGTTLSAGVICGGLVTRSGPSANFTDTIDTADNILNALSGGANNNVPVVEPGTTFRLRIMNNSSYTETISGQSGVVLGSGTFTLATVTWREFLVTVLAVQKVQSLLCVTTASSTAVTFSLPIGQVALAIGPSQYANNIVTGAVVSGTGIATNTTVAGVTQGQGGILGITLSGTATASGTVLLSFGSTIRLDSLGAGTAQ